MKLLIVESPSKCAKIEGYLGSEYQCIASCGHIREIARGLSDINHLYEPTFTWMEDKKEHIQKMRKIAKAFKPADILLATDDDREGEAIAWHICEVLGISVETTPRIVFHEITQSALLHAVQNPRRIHMSVVKAQQARQVLDLLVGYKVSPCLWRVFYYSKNKSLSAGRCQTPTLRLIYDNDRLERAMEIKYRTTGYFFPSRGMELNHEFDHPDQVRAFLDESKNHIHELSLLPRKDKFQSPPLPLTTSRLLQLASNVLHSCPKTTMQVCQNLYQQGRITYMRTDSSTYSKDFLRLADEFIRSQYGADYVDGSPSSSSDASAAAHEAIRVTDLSVLETPDDQGGGGGRESSMYRLIWRNTVESCMKNSHYHVFPLRVSAPQDLQYHYSIEIPVFLGWKRVQYDHRKQREEDESARTFLQQVQQCKRVSIEHVRCTAAARHTHSHYTEASLVKKLEEMGIGRPSTYASLVETIQDRGYVLRTDVPGQSREVIDFVLRSGLGVEEIPSTKVFGQEKDKLVIQPTGTVCMEFLLQYFEELFAYDYTQKMEEQLDLIATSSIVGSSIRANMGYDLCHQCSETIDRLVAPVGALGKMVFPVDENHALVFQTHGVCLRRTDLVDKSTTYLPVSKEIDVERAKLGLYTLSEIMSDTNGNPLSRLLGQHDGHDIFLKRGRYGPYLEWNHEKKSVKGHEEGMTLTTAIEILQHRTPPQQAGMLRTINTDCSIREGKYGPYVYYKTSEMKSPMFFALRQFNWAEASDADVLSWLQQELHNAPKKKTTSKSIPSKTSKR